MKCEDFLLRRMVWLQCAHHERLAPATLNLSGCIVSPVRRPRLERGGRRFESCHPDHLPTQSIPTQLLTLHHGADAYSVGHAAVTRRSASSVVVRIHVAPPSSIGPLAQPADATPSKGGCSGFESRVAYQVHCPAGGIGIRAGLRNQILPVRVRGGAPVATGGWQSGNAPVLKTEMVSEPGRVGSIPTPPAIAWSVARVAMGRLAKPQPVGNRREGSTPSRSASHNTHNVGGEPKPTATQT